MRWARIRIENHEVATTAPREFFTRNKVFDLVRVRSVDPKVFNRNVGMSTLGIVWIESHQDQNDIVESLRRSRSIRPESLPFLNLKSDL
jgi:hypothetical protein